MKNYRYHVVRANNVAFDFSVADFPLINLHDLLCVAKILKFVNVSQLQVTNKDDFLLGFTHIKGFIDGYYGALSLTDIELATTFRKQIYVPQSMLRNQTNLKDYEDGEICLKPLGIVFVGKNKKGNNTKFLFQVCDVERYNSCQYINLMVQMNSCAKNNDKEKAETRKIVNYYDEVRRVIH